MKLWIFVTRCVDGKPTPVTLPYFHPLHSGHHGHGYECWILIPFVPCQWALPFQISVYFKLRLCKSRPLTDSGISKIKTSGATDVENFGKITTSEWEWCPPWWRHQMEIFSALLAFCGENPLVTGEFLSQRPATRSFDVIFNLRLNKRMSKQSKRPWFETSLWRHCNTYDCRTSPATWSCTALPLLWHRHTSIDLQLLPEHRWPQCSLG